MKRLSLTALALSSCLILPAAAQETQKPEESACFKSLQELEETHADVLPHLSSENRRKLQAHRKTVRFLAKDGREEVCTSVVGEIETLLTDKREKLVEDGLMVTEEKAARMEKLNQSKPLADVTTSLTSSDIVGLPIRNLQDEFLGEVDDIVIDADDKKLDYLIATYGGFLGIWATQAAVPVKIVRATDDMKTLVIDRPQSILEKAPAVDLDDLSPLQDSAWQTANDSYFEAN